MEDEKPHPAPADVDEDDVNDDCYDDDEDDDDAVGIVAPPVIDRIEADGDTRGRAEDLGEGVEQHV
jgi:hypothetical protein